MPQTIDLSEPGARRRPWAALAVWTAIVIVYALVLHAQIRLPLGEAFVSASVYFYTLALLMVPVRRWCDRLLRHPRSLVTRAAAHAGMAAFVLVLWHAVLFLFYLLTIGPDFWRFVYAGNWLFQFLSAATAYGAALGITLASLAWARERERAERERELEIAARDAELSAIKAQFQPHFVLNALTSLLALVDRDPALARTMIVRLADLMRAVFERADQDEVPLERELDLIRAYLDVERIRLGSRLSVTIDVDDAARGVRVPALLLQPIVENAVKHGIAPFAGAGRLEVRATVIDGRLRIVVRDSGRTPAPAAAAAGGSGRGLQITRRRLDGAFGTAYQFSMSHDRAGTAVHIDLPADRSDVA
jgi:sensor histidine kinase YesM